MGFKPGQSGNPAGRPKGAKTKRTELLESVRKQFGSEGEFWAHVATKAKEGDNECLRILAARLRAPLKSVAAPINIEIDTTSIDSSLKSILEAVARGQVPSDQASDLLAAIKNISEIAILRDLEQRITQIEDQVRRRRA